MKALVNIDVDDLEKAIAFYTSAFGVSVGRRFAGQAAELVGGSVPIYLLLEAAGTSPSPATSQLRSYDRHWTPVHLDLVVDDVEAAVERALAAGAKLEKPVNTRSWGKLAVLSDPFGHGFCLLQFLGRGYDEIADPE